VTSPVLPGAEPFSADGGPAGALVLHGFTGNPYSMRPVAVRLADAGFTVELPLLPGHGTAIEDLVPMRWNDWASAVDAAYRALAARCDSVALVGLSMGGTLACWLAERYTEVVGVALVNPFVEPPNDDLAVAVRDLYASGTEIAPGIGSDIADPQAKELSYDGAPLAALLSLFEGVEEVALHLDEIRCPVLLLSSRQDHVVAPSNGDLLVASVSGPCERVWLERSYHVATLDYDRQEVEDRIEDFVRSVSRPAAGDGGVVEPEGAGEPHPVT
jgi:carboxylesterase